MKRILARIIGLASVNGSEASSHISNSTPVKC
jgi:hypothetical protein